MRQVKRCELSASAGLPKVPYIAVTHIYCSLAPAEQCPNVQQAALALSLHHYCPDGKSHRHSESELTLSQVLKEALANGQQGPVVLLQDGSGRQHQLCIAVQLRNLIKALCQPETADGKHEE